MGLKDIKYDILLCRSCHMMIINLNGLDHILSFIPLIWVSHSCTLSSFEYSSEQRPDAETFHWNEKDQDDTESFDGLLGVAGGQRRAVIKFRQMRDSLSLKWEAGQPLPAPASPC